MQEILCKLLDEENEIIERKQSQTGMHITIINLSYYLQGNIYLSSRVSNSQSKKGEEKGKHSRG
jgi:hypothetical protein